MRSHVFLALSSPAEGRDDEFHRWYDAYHLQDVVDLCPGFTSGHRYFGAGDDHPTRWPSLAIYRLTSDDLAALHRDVSTNAGRFTPSGGVFAPDHVAWVYSATLADSAALDAWLAAAEEGPVTLAFYDSLDETGPVAGAAPILERGDGQRAGEHPTWRYLRLIRGQALPPATPAAIWRYDPRGTRAHTQPRN